LANERLSPEDVRLVIALLEPNKAIRTIKWAFLLSFLSFLLLLWSRNQSNFESGGNFRLIRNTLSDTSPFKDIFGAAVEIM